MALYTTGKFQVGDFLLLGETLTSADKEAVAKTTDRAVIRKGFFIFICLFVLNSPRPYHVSVTQMGKNCYNYVTFLATDVNNSANNQFASLISETKIKVQKANEP